MVSVAAPDQPAAEPLRQRKLSMYKTHRDEEKMEKLGCSLRFRV